MSKLKVTTIADVTDSESTNVTNVINGSAKAWVNFNGTGTVAINRAFNVSSITDNGTGQYTINFTNAMPDANYGAAWMTNRADCLGGANGIWSTTQIGARTRNGANTDQDTSIVSVAIFS